MHGAVARLPVDHVPLGGQRGRGGLAVHVAAAVPRAVAVPHVVVVVSAASPGLSSAAAPEYLGLSRLGNEHDQFLFLSSSSSSPSLSLSPLLWIQLRGPRRPLLLVLLLIPHQLLLLLLQLPTFHRHIRHIVTNFSTSSSNSGEAGEGTRRALLSLQSFAEDTPSLTEHKVE